MKFDLLLLVFFFSCSFAQKSLWEQCGDIKVNIPVYGETSFNECIELFEKEDCSLIGSLKINNQLVFEQPFDLSGAPKACGTLPGFPYCEACVNLVPFNATQDCAELKVSCRGFPVSSQNLGCFASNAIIDEINKCQYKCPMDCSGNGSCDKGFCVCDTGFYGDACNVSIPTYGTCIDIPIDQQTEQLCGEFQFLNCEVNFNVRLSREMLYTQNFPLYQFMTTFTSPYCYTLLDCSLCFEWTNLTLNNTTVAGCSAMTTSCGSGGGGSSGSGSSKTEYPFFCFEDSEIVPYCLGRCASDCSFQGECNQGRCVCDPKFTGNDCSIPINCGESNCGGESHGRCENGQCVCTSDYQGSDCSIPATISKPADSKKKSDSTLWIILGLLSALILFVFLGVIIYFKRKDKRDREGFVRLELFEEEDHQSQDL